MIKRDLPEVLQIERDSFDQPWTDRDFVNSLRSGNTIGIVAEISKPDEVVGFVVYDLHAKHIHLANMAVSPWYRKAGVGRALLAKLKNKLSRSRRSRIFADVRETNLDAQLFFAACGFKATRVLRGHYETSAEDAYEFCFELGNPAGMKLAS